MLRNLILTLCLFAVAAADVARPTIEAGRKILAASDALLGYDAPPASVRKWYYNPGNIYREQGSCVQCGLGMVGCRCNILGLATLLWDSPYGPAIHGGSDPDRVAAYCRDRKIPIYNVTGKPTVAFAEWACRTNRGAAIGFGTRHFQTLMSHDSERDLWYVCDNNSPQQVDEYSRRDFIAGHEASGRWIVVPDCPAPPAPPHK